MLVLLYLLNWLLKVNVEWSFTIFRRCYIMVFHFFFSNLNKVYGAPFNRYTFSEGKFEIIEVLLVYYYRADFFFISEMIHSFLRSCEIPVSLQLSTHIVTMIVLWLRNFNWLKIIFNRTYPACTYLRDFLEIKLFCFEILVNCI